MPTEKKTKTKSAKRAKRKHRGKSHRRRRNCTTVWITPGSPPGDPGDTYIYADGCVEWKTTDGSDDWTVSFQNNETPFKHFHFHPGRSQSGKPNSNATHKHHYKYSIQTNGGLPIDPQVIIH